MGVGTGSQPLRPADLEAWLGRTLVPVDPGEPFVARLRARLVELRGARPTRGWTLLLVGLGLGLAVAVWLGAAIRFVLAVLAVVGILEHRRRSRKSE